jgi:hypothetical protein
MLDEMRVNDEQLEVEVSDIRQLDSLERIPPQ